MPYMDPSVSGQLFISLDCFLNHTEQPANFKVIFSSFTDSINDIGKFLKITNLL